MDMKSRKIELMEELLEHLGDAEGSALKSMLDESKAPPQVEGIEIEKELPDGMESEVLEVEADPMEEKVDMGDMPEMDGSAEEEMTEEELRELLAKHLSE